MKPSSGETGRTARNPWPGPWATPRIAVGGIAHETNTFSSVPTTLDDVVHRSYLVGEDLVLTALLTIGDVAVVVTERRLPTVGPARFRSGGIDPTSCRIVALKSSVHFRAAFAPLSAAVIEVETPGLSGSHLAAFRYRRVRRPIAPLDPSVRDLD